MANSLYDKGRQRFLEAQLNWLTDDIKVVMVDTGVYTFASTHEFFASIPVAARITAPTTLTNKTSTNGAADAQDVTFAAVNGPSLEALVIYREVLGTDHAEIGALLADRWRLPSYLKDVIAFPKNTFAMSPMDDCPNVVDEKQLKEIHIRVVPKEEPTAK